MSASKRQSSRPTPNPDRRDVIVESRFQERLYRQAEQLARLGHYEWDEVNRRLIACSQGYARIFELSVAEVLAEFSEYEDDLNLVHPDDRESYVRALERATESRETLTAEYRILTRSGAVRHVREIMECRPSPRNTRFGTLLDVTEQKQTERQLRDSYRILTAIIEGTPDYVFVKDLDGRYTRLNSAAAREVGRPMEDIIGKTCFDLFPPELAAATDREDRQVLSAGQPLVFEHGSGTGGQILLTTKYAYHDENGRPLGIIGISRDITELKRAEERIRYLAYHDELTRLPSVRLARDRLAGAMARARREGSSVALLYLDLDDFKEVNDARGHGAGDQVLISVAERLTGCVRETDTVARVGGDEFVVVLAGETVAPETVARKILRALARPIEVDDRPVNISVSIGIACYRGGRETPEELIERADQVMYQVKREGKNSFAEA